ncbi:hypothetical protein AB0K18_24810 [Nonomuraea sp. NPDC049421]|uniref:hypothetical protein n=1 Tax=Nonomuraea sp. NPDC049421 TaxID=3155275 RepID=UPI00344045FB
MTDIDLDRFVTDGFAKVPGTVPREVGDEARALLWAGPAYCSCWSCSPRSARTTHPPASAPAPTATWRPRWTNAWRT